MLKAFLQVLFFGMDRHSLFKRELDFPESLSIKKFIKTFLEMFFFFKSCIIYGLYLFHNYFKLA